MDDTILWLSALGAAIVSIGLIPLAIKLSFALGLLDMPGAHKRHHEPTPFVGGVVMFLTVWLTVLVTGIAADRLTDLFTIQLLYIFLGALIIVLVGFSDDISPVSAWVKLLAQVGAGTVLYLGGLNVELLTSPVGSIDVGWLSPVITVLWVVGLTNAVNLIDGLDGLATGVSLIGAATILVIGTLYDIGPSLLFLTALIGFLAVFLWFNRFPARIFLGDSGSMQIGYYFAVVSLLVPIKSYTATALYLPLVALGVPIIESASSLVRRLASRKSIMKADRRHLFHYLALAGWSARKIVLAFYSLAIAFGLFALAMYYLDRALLFGLLVIFMVVIFAAFFIITNNLAQRRRGRNAARRVDDEEG